MLRNSYFEWYQKDKKRKSEYEKMIMNYDGEQILFLDRPLSMTNIKKISENDFPIFVNDLMCEKGTGHLLFPASFRNQVNLYLKQQSYAYKVTTFNKNKNFIEMMKELKREEYRKLIINNDGEQILFLERPLSMMNIKKISENDFPIFVNDLMCEKKTGHLLFPLSFRSHVNLYLKQQGYIYKLTTFNKNKNFIEMMKDLKRKRNKE